MQARLNKLFLLAAILFTFSSCAFFKGSEAKPRLAMFIGVDISGSFMRTAHFDDSLRFLAHYIFCHLKGWGGLEVPRTLYVGAIGGFKPDEPKTFFPIQTFQNKTVEEITDTLREIFPRKRENQFTDFNAYFQQVASFVKNKNLILRPISIVMLSDGKPEMANAKTKEQAFRKIELAPLENLSRNITLRLLYTGAEVGLDWQEKIPRRRVKIWTQDAEVMKEWKAKNVLIPNKDLQEQQIFFDWILDNVDFRVRIRRVT